MYKALITLISCATFAINALAMNYELSSPNSNLKVIVKVEEELKISVFFNNTNIIDLSPVSMKLRNNIVLGNNSIVENKSIRSIQREIIPEIKIKEAVINENFNELRLDFKGNYSLIIRAYNEGMAYCFETNLGNKITVLEENTTIDFVGDFTCWWGRERKFQSNNQVYYEYLSTDKIGNKDLASLPLISKSDNGVKIVFTETGLRDYPGAWVNGADGSADFSLTFPKYPKEINVLSDRYLPIMSRENYIAKTNGTRSFPWRIFAITEDDGDLVTNQLTYLLSQPCELEDVSWIKPGKIAWDWWNANNVYGVDFESGINTETYKYYIDFASKYGIEYIIIDEGWYVLGDLFDISPGINIKELVKYAKEKKVGIILWVVWKTLDEQLHEALDKFQEWGIKGIKVDFMDRDDQWMVNYYEKIARESAKRKLMIDFHGSYKPAGLRRPFPNVMTREGVNGGEQFKWSMKQTPEHDLILPFGRMLAGPLDYTPGAMTNAQKDNFRPIFNRPMSMGTRCHQLAMYVIYESPLQMLCDHPSNYYREHEAMEFLEAVPTIWDQTIVLSAKISDYLVMARRLGEKWFIGGMTDWKERKTNINFSFLPKKKKYKMILLKDGINANKWASDFKRIVQVVDSSTKLELTMSKGGGFAAQLIPME